MILETSDYGKHVRHFDKRKAKKKKKKKDTKEKQKSIKPVATRKAGSPLIT